MSQRGLKEDVLKYGWENFNFDVVERCEEEQLKEKELYYIRLFENYEANKGYNRKTKRIVEG